MDQNKRNWFGYDGWDLHYVDGYWYVYRAGGPDFWEMGGSYHMVGSFEDVMGYIVYAKKRENAFLGA